MAKDFISEIFSPCVAVSASEDVESLMQNSNFESFAEFLRPFGKIVKGKALVKSPAGQANYLENYSIRLMEYFRCRKEFSFDLNSPRLAEVVMSNASEEILAFSKRIKKSQDVHGSGILNGVI